MKTKVPHKPYSLKLSESGFTHGKFLVLIFLVFGIIILLRINSNHVSADSPKITSGVSGYCMNNKKDNSTDDTTVDSWRCNSTDAQVFSFSGARITDQSKDCVSVFNNSTTINSKVVMASCTDQPGQVWLRDNSGFFNPNSGLCLSSNSSDPSSYLFIDTCSLSSTQQIWNLNGNNSDPTSCKGAKGDVIACNAEAEWARWEKTGSNHTNLLNTYTDGAPYEEWCADFVSYVYKESGFPFTQGESNGWDENNANNIQNMGFTMHVAGSGYVPKPGDVAYFDYSGGHVEIVVSGGSKPTFIYGNSATIDPTTGNGEMMSNTLTNDGSLGQLMYYLSPN